MCGGGGGDQTVTQRTEIDPELRRLLYGGALTSAHGLRDPNAPRPLSGGGSSLMGGGGGGSMWSDGMTGAQINAERAAGTFGSGMPDSQRGASFGDSFGGSSPSQGGFGGSTSDHVGSGGMYAMGGSVQSGIASMQPNMPMTQNMPMMNGMLPNLSDPEIAATLAMAQMRPQMMMGMGSGGMPQQEFALGGIVASRFAPIFAPFLSVLSNQGQEAEVPLPQIQRPEYQPQARPVEENPELVRQIVAQGRANYFPDTPAGTGMPQPPTLEMDGRPLQFAVGGYVEGPGTGTSDDIPATIYQDGMPVQNAALSDGEFVMTERAVRNAGGGDRDRGAARMYEMMRMFEQGGRV